MNEDKVKALFQKALETHALKELRGYAIGFASTKGTVQPDSLAQLRANGSNW